MSILAVSGRDVIRILTKAGFKKAGAKGSHIHLQKVLGGKTLHVTVPAHQNKDLNTFVLHAIARQAGYTFEEFVQLFRN